MKKLLIFSAAMLQTAVLMAQNPAKQKMTDQQIKTNAAQNQAMELRNGAARPDRHLFMIVPETNIQQMHDRIDLLLPRNMAYRQDKFEK